MIRSSASRCTGHSAADYCKKLSRPRDIDVDRPLLSTVKWACISLAGRIMSGPGPSGPELDALAAAAISLEDERHRRRLREIEQEQPARWDELLAEENHLHLKLLTEVYVGLADRRLQGSQTLEEEEGSGRGP